MPKNIQHLHELNRQRATELKTAYEANPKVCHRCGSKLEYVKRYNKFCSHSCSASFNNTGVRRHPERVEKPKPEAKPTIATLWLQGLHEGLASDGASLARSIRSYLIRTRGARCEECGWDKVNPTTGKCPIHVDHVDGNYKNNSPDNLKLLCPNCHALTSTYGSLNRGNGRPYVVYKKATQLNRDRLNG